MECSLCQNPKVDLFFQGEGRDYYQCLRCHLIFVPPAFHLKPGDERRRYLEHHNSPEDSRYRAFLGRLVTPLLQCLRPGVRGLDFGCGPGPTVSVMLEEQGYSVENYDPFFAPEPKRLKTPYDFITATETVEHLREPRREIQQLNRWLRPGGLLAIMTCFLKGDQEFSQWYYRRDPTHIAFYRESTMKWIASHWAWRLEFPEENVCFFWKP